MSSPVPFHRFFDSISSKYSYNFNRNLYRQEKLLEERERDLPPTHERIFNSVVEALSKRRERSLDARIKILLRFRSDSQSGTPPSSRLPSRIVIGRRLPAFSSRGPGYDRYRRPDDYKCESFHHSGRSFPRVFTGESGGEIGIAIDAIALCKRAASPVF